MNRCTEGDITGTAVVAVVAASPTLLRRLEEYQRDLEEETADVADLIRRLKEEKTQTASV